jgi:hypothetical protein
MEIWRSGALQYPPARESPRTLAQRLERVLVERQDALALLEQLLADGAPADAARIRTLQARLASLAQEQADLVDALQALLPPDGPPIA